jgi:hypothetical protein
VFSPGKKTFSFGHPSVEKVAERFISGNTPQILGAFQLIEAHRNARVCELNMQLSQVLIDKDFESICILFCLFICLCFCKIYFQKIS